MQRTCSSCGRKLDEYVFVFRPNRAQEIVAGIKAEFPNIDFTINTVEGEKIKITLRQFLTPTQKTKMDDYFTDVGYIEDLEAESMENSLSPMKHEVVRMGSGKKRTKKRAKKGG